MFFMNQKSAQYWPVQKDKSLITSRFTNFHRKKQTQSADETFKFMNTNLCKNT